MANIIRRTARTFTYKNNANSLTNTFHLWVKIASHLTRPVQVKEKSNCVKNFGGSHFIFWNGCPEGGTPL